MLRIRYQEHPTREECVISINDFVSQRTGARYKVVIDYRNMQYAIRNERTKEFVYKSGSYTNKNAIRRAARNRLKAFGVNMGRESRNRTFGRCDKNWTQEKQRELENKN